MNNAQLARLVGANIVTDDTVYFYGGVFSSFASLPFRAPLMWDAEALVTWPTREHYFQAHKARTAEEALAILEPQYANPWKAKAYGRSLTFRDDWEEIEYGVMLEGIRIQLQQHPEFMACLELTGGREIREDSPTDDVWGYRDVGHGPGQNLLGRALMQAREEVMPVQTV